jgi:hypothetical protein
MTSTNNESVQGCVGVTGRFLYISLHGEVQTTPTHPYTSLSQSSQYWGPERKRRPPKDGADGSSSALPLALRARAQATTIPVRGCRGPDLPVVLPGLPPKAGRETLADDRFGARRRTSRPQQVGRTNTQ